MAPERFAGGALDYRVDVFALGVILYELVAGARPFGEGGPLATPRPTVGWPDFSGHRWSRMGPLKEVTARMLAREPRKRTTDGAQALAALRHVAFRASGVYARTSSSAVRPAAAEHLVEGRCSHVSTQGATETGDVRPLRPAPVGGARRSGRKGPGFVPSQVGPVVLLALAILLARTAELAREPQTAVAFPPDLSSEPARGIDGSLDEAAPPEGADLARPVDRTDPPSCDGPVDSLPTPPRAIPLAPRRSPSRPRAPRRPAAATRATAVAPKPLSVGRNGAPIFP
jgi:hypothetical protein